MKKSNKAVALRLLAVVIVVAALGLIFIKQISERIAVHKENIVKKKREEYRQSGEYGLG